MFLIEDSGRDGEDAEKMFFETNRVVDILIFFGFVFSFETIRTSSLSECFDGDCYGMKLLLEFV